MTPDMLPSLALAATQRKGGTLFSNAARLRFKESDRLHSVCSVLNSLGADIEELPDGLLVHGGKRLRGGVEVSSFGDHRIVMMEAVASTVCDGPVVIDGYECVAKSYPGFFDDFTVCGGKADVF
jgi:5-enolpyruvylshikimate-3-phosphate synthase